MENSATERNFSSIKQIEKVVNLALPISFISNEKTGVIEVLDSWIRQYNQQLEGILVSYSDVSLLSRRNNVISDKYFVLVEVKATFHLFCPSVGDVVKGKINRISKEHIGCLMHDTINVVIWLSDDHTELNKFIRLEQEILFEISHFNIQRKEVRVQGRITPECVQLMEDLFPVLEEGYLTNSQFTSQNAITHYDLFDDIKYTLSDKFESNQVNTIVNGTTTDSSSIINEAMNISPKKEKKSKKRKRDSTQEVLDSTEAKPKKSKKRKKIFEVADKGITDFKEEMANFSTEFNNDCDDVDKITDFKEETVNFSTEFNDCENADSSLSLKTDPAETTTISSKRHSKKKLSDDQQKKKKKKKSDKKEKHNSKKSKMVASGLVLKADKKNKKKHSKKDGVKKKDKKKLSKKGDKSKKDKKGKDKKSKHKKHVINGAVIKTED